MALGPSAEKYLAKVNAQVAKFEETIDKGIDNSYTGGGSITISLPESPYPETKQKLMEMYTATKVGWKLVKFDSGSQYNESYHTITLYAHVVRETTSRGYWEDR